jgi:hypothetical protein
LLEGRYACTSEVARGRATDGREQTSVFHASSDIEESITAGAVAG